MTQYQQNEAGAGPDESIRASFVRLIVSGRELVSAEFAWLRLKGLNIAAILRRAALFATVAVVFLVVALSLLLVAGVLALAPLVGLLGATLIVSGVAFLGAGLFAALARARLRQLFDREKP